MWSVSARGTWSDTLGATCDDGISSRFSAARPRPGRSPRARQPALPVIGFVNGGAADAWAVYAAAFRKGLGETGYIEGQNVTIEYHCWRANKELRARLHVHFLGD